MSPRRKRGRPARVRGPAVLLAVALFAPAGCSTISPVPSLPAAPVKSWEAAQIIDVLSRRRGQFRSMRALARVAYSGPDGKRTFQEAVQVQRPNWLRLETLSMLGAILIVTVNDKEIVGYHPREGLFLRGARTKRAALGGGHSGLLRSSRSRGCCTIRAGPSARVHRRIRRGRPDR